MSFVYIPDVPGLGFYPTDEQICVYLKQRIEEHGRGCSNSMSGFFPDIDLCKFKPSELPPLIESLTMGSHKRREWYFFSPRSAKSSGSNRTVPQVGHWKITGNRSDVISETTGEKIGKKSVLVFDPSSSSTLHESSSLVIHEYNLNPSYLGSNKIPFVACCLKKKARNESSGEGSSRDGSSREGPSYDIYSSLSPFQSLD